MEIDKVELRCPYGRLFAKVIMDGHISDNLFEVACYDCAKASRSHGVVRVLHRFNVIGELVETIEEHR